MAVVGTTSFEMDNLDYVPVIEDHVQLMLERGAELDPRNSQCESARQIYGYASIDWSG